MMVLSKEHHEYQARSICQMRSSHTAAAVSAVFDDENLIGYGGGEAPGRVGEGGALPGPGAPRGGVHGGGQKGGGDTGARRGGRVRGGGARGGANGKTTTGP